MRNLTPYLYFTSAMVLAVVAFLAIRFFWKHILKHLVQGCLVIAAVLILAVGIYYLLQPFLK